MGEKRPHRATVKYTVDIAPIFGGKSANVATCRLHTMAEEIISIITTIPNKYRTS